jgi:hypothetical protein
MENSLLSTLLFSAHRMPNLRRLFFMYVIISPIFTPHQFGAVCTTFAPAQQLLQKSTDGASGIIFDACWRVAHGASHDTGLSPTH